MSRIHTVSLLALLVPAASTYAWQVPLYSTTYNPGPHKPGDPIECTYTNDDGQSFTGTITSDGSGGLVCAGVAEPDLDAVIAAEATRLDLQDSGDCAVVATGSAVLDANPSLVRQPDIAIEGGSVAVYCADDAFVGPDEQSEDRVVIAGTPGQAHEVIVTERTRDYAGNVVESELAYDTLQSDSSGQISMSLGDTRESSEVQVQVRTVDPEGFGKPLATFESTESGFQTRVLALKTTVDSVGGTVRHGPGSVTFRLTSWGREGATGEAGPAKTILGDCADAHALLPEACVSRVELARDGILEFWQSLSDGLLQAWTVHSRPEGEGPLVLDVAFDGAHDWIVDADGLGTLVRTGTGTTLRYEDLLVIDANNKTVPAVMVATEQGVRLEVSDLDTTAYPLLIDPAIKLICSMLKPRPWR